MGQVILKLQKAPTMEKVVQQTAKTADSAHLQYRTTPKRNSQRKDKKKKPE